MKPTKKQVAAFKAWFERLCDEIESELNTVDSTIALHEVKALDDGYQIQLRVTREEDDFCSRVMTAEDA